LVNNVLDFSRLEQRRKQYTIESFDIFTETRIIVEAQRPRIEQAGMRLIIDLPADPCERPLDRDVLEQALLNLIENAIKYAGAGGDLTVAWDRSGRIEICDRGPGIPPSQRKRIFRSYHRIDDSLTAHQAGCGLGLTIARQLLRGLGGDLVFNPREGGGACFAIVLPKDMKGIQ
jgi:signal transduction histidine kinase